LLKQSGGNDLASKAHAGLQHFQTSAQHSAPHPIENGIAEKDLKASQQIVSVRHAKSVWSADI